MTQKQVAKGLGIYIPGLSKIEGNQSDINIASLLLENKPIAVFGNERVTELEKEIKDYQTKIMELQQKLLACFENK